MPPAAVHHIDRRQLNGRVPTLTKVVENTELSLDIGDGPYRDQIHRMSEALDYAQNCNIMLATLLGAVQAKRLWHPATHFLLPQG